MTKCFSCKLFFKLLVSWWWPVSHWIKHKYTYTIWAITNVILYKDGDCVKLQIYMWQIWQTQNLYLHYSSQKWNKVRFILGGIISSRFRDLAILVAMFQICKEIISGSINAIIDLMSWSFGSVSQGLTDYWHCHLPCFATHIVLAFRDFMCKCCLHYLSTVSTSFYFLVQCPVTLNLSGSVRHYSFWPPSSSF